MASRGRRWRTLLLEVGAEGSEMAPCEDFCGRYARRERRGDWRVTARCQRSPSLAVVPPLGSRILDEHASRRIGGGARGSATSRRNAYLLPGLPCRAPPVAAGFRLTRSVRRRESQSAASPRRVETRVRDDDARAKSSRESGRQPPRTLAHTRVTRRRVSSARFLLHFVSPGIDV